MSSDIHGATHDGGAGRPSPPPGSVVLRGPRVRLRTWTDADRAPFAALNADPEVMRHFRAPLGRADSEALVDRVMARLAERGWGWWALETDTLPFAGFVGLAEVPFQIPLPGFGGPQVEVGWRLARAAWGHGWASEAATLALDFAHQRLGVARVVSFTAWSNTRSAAVMQRIGLQRVGEFMHPGLAGHALERHLLYAG